MNTKLKNTLLAFLLMSVLLIQLFPAQTASAAICDAATFIADVTVPDGTIFGPTVAFTKTWRLKNSGTCTWTTSYKLVFAGGSQLSGQEVTPLPSTVLPGASIDLSLDLVSLAGDSTYRGYWQLMNAAGARFGIGPAADKFFWVEIVVRGGFVQPTPTSLSPSDDFASSGGNASWLSGAGALSFPGTDGDSRGFAIKLESVQLETGAMSNQPALLTVPQNKTDGYIQGLYPALMIRTGDRFQATIGCQYGVTACYVTYRIDYRTSVGIKTLWTFREKYDGKTYNVDLDLSFLAGKSTEFFLMVLANGSAAGDRALWVAPRIVHADQPPPTNVSPTLTGMPPTSTAPVDLTQTPTVVMTPPNTGCDRATFIADVTVPDGAVFASNTAFTKTWRIKNTGTCAWTTAYKLVFASGTQMGGPGESSLTSAVAPNEMVDLSVNLTAPAVDGTYRGYWQLKNASGALFGIGSAADKPFWVEIVVQGGGITATPPSPTPGPSQAASQTMSPPPIASDDFASNGGSARWQSGAGVLPFPGTDGDTRGFALKLEGARLETGGGANVPTLLMAPQKKTDGYIQGSYPALAIRTGDRFQAMIGCQYGATTCYVTYRIDYRTSAGVRTLWTFKERYDGKTYDVDLDLSSLAGKNVEFFLMVLTSGSPTGDRALWVAPRIVHAGGTPPTDIAPSTKTPTPTPTPTLTDAPSTPITPAGPTPTKTVGASPTPTVTPTLAIPATLPPNMGDHFALNGGSARWQSGAGALSFPGVDGDSRGFALKLETFQVETGAFVNQPSLLMVPQKKTDGYIQGLYPSIPIRNGDHFQAAIGCQYGATACYVTYRIDYRTSAGLKTLWTFKERYDGKTYNVDLDLSSLAGKNVEFFLLVLASGSPTGDRAVWIAPRIVHSSTPSATPTPPPGQANWLTYSNPKYQFQFQYPPEGQISNQEENGAYIGLPVAPGTNLTSKYLQVAVFENVSSCSSLPVGGSGGPSQPVTINGIAFNKETGQDQGAGQIRQWTNFFTVKGNLCLSMGFVLHSGAIGAFPPGTPEFNFEAESAVIMQIMSTFTWPGSTSTPTQIVPVGGAYAVLGVASNDVLNMRSGAGVGYPIVDSLAFDANNVARSGAAATVDGDIWWEVQKPGGATGWVNAFYLTEYTPAATFCGDNRVTALLANLGNAVKTSNGAAFAALVHSKHGVDVRLAKYNAQLNFSKVDAASIFTSAAALNWGPEPGSGQDVIGTFKDVMQPKLLEVYNSNYVWTCNDTSKTGPVTNPWPYTSINFYSLYKPGTPSVELDWRTFLAGIEFVDGQPYLFSLIHYQWEP